MNTRDKSSYKIRNEVIRDIPKSSKKASTHSASFFRRIDLRFPWFKLAAVIVFGIAAILDLCDLTVSKISDSYGKIIVAPMSKHVRVTTRILEGKKLVVLTFDDGPSSATTPNLLDILYEKDVPATFFMLGNMARNNPEIVTRAAREGHEVASHTMYHQNLIRLSASAVKSDIDEARSTLQGILGSVPSFTRPPYGNINDNVRQYVGTPMILWSVDTLDWKDKNIDSIVNIAMSQVHDGAIILMHDIYPTTVEAVPILIDTLRSAGYEFATIPELTKIRGIELSPGVAYYNFRP